MIVVRISGKYSYAAKFRSFISQKRGKPLWWVISE